MLSVIQSITRSPFLLNVICYSIDHKITLLLNVICYSIDHKITFWYTAATKAARIRRLVISAI